MNSVDIIKYFLVINFIQFSYVKCYVCRPNKTQRELRFVRSVKPEREEIIQNNIKLLTSSLLNETLQIPENLISKEVCRTVVRDIDANSTASVEFNVGSTLYGTEHENGCKAIKCERYNPKTDVMEMSINTCGIVNPKDSQKRKGDPTKEYPHCCEPVSEK